jgi:endo-1,4-beta-xylanase
MNSSLDIRQRAAYRESTGVMLGAGGFRREFLTDRRITKTLKDHGFTGISSSPSMLAWNLLYVKHTESYNFEFSDQIVAYAQTNNYKLHATPLIWPHKTTPKWLTEQEKTLTKEQLKQLMKTHIQTVARRYKGKIDSYDVVNEAIDENGQHRDTLFYRLLGEEYIELAFRWVREADPEAKLFYNDFGIESARGGSNKKAIAAYNLVKRLKAKGVPIDGVGFQSHVNNDMKEYTQREVQDQINLYKDLGVEVAISEIDVQVMTDKPNREQLEAQADIFRRFATACVLSENCKRYTTWGISDKDSWFRVMFKRAESPLLFDEEFQPKPAYLSVARALGLHEYIQESAAVENVERAQRNRERGISNSEPTSYSIREGEVWSSAGESK